MTRFFVFILMCLAATSCSSRSGVISQRPLVDATRSDGAVAVNTREVEPPPAQKEFYIRGKELAVKPKKRPSQTGSLSSVEDARSYQLPGHLPLTVGTILDIKTASNRNEAGPNSPGATAGSLAGGGSAPTDDKSSAQLEQTLMKALPNLEPGSGTEKPTIVRNFKMQVIDIRDNGDAVVAYHRRSLRANQAADILINAVIPYAALTDRENLSTSQLESIRLTESQDGEVIERVSTNWEDEYTLRVSGFDEAKSKSALVLEDQKRQLKDARDKVVSQIKSLGQERQTMTKERQTLLDNKKKDEEKIADLETKLKERDEEIAKLKPKEEEATADSETALAGESDTKNKPDKSDKVAKPTANPKSDPKEKAAASEKKVPPSKAAVPTKEAQAKAKETKATETKAAAAKPKAQDASAKPGGAKS